MPMLNVNHKLKSLNVTTGRVEIHSWNGIYEILKGGHSGRVITLSPPTSKAGVRFSARPQMGKLVVGCHWLAGYSTKS